MAGPVVLLTDFGQQDSYTGVMKGVIAEIAPSAPILDLSHQVPPGEIPRAAFMLWQSFTYFPVGTVFLCVVDPGVGTSRKPMAFELGGRFGVGPDNGVFTYVLQGDTRARVVAPLDPRYHLELVSATFHGRDIFAPVAGHLAAGIPLEELGPSLLEPVSLPIPKLFLESGQIRGRTLYADHFGNLITSIGRVEAQENTLSLHPWLGQCPPRQYAYQKLHAHLPGGWEIPWGKTFAEVERGEPVMYIGSSGLVEIAINGGSAARRLNLDSNQDITILVEG